jgi:outer membrane receptor protein involved in Fe transport
MLGLMLRTARLPLLLMVSTSAALLAMTALPVHAQQNAHALVVPEGRITGTVISAQDSLPVPGVHVFLEHTSLGSVTDDRGWFAIDAIPPGEFGLVNRYVGFETLRRDVEVLDDTVQVELAISPATEFMDEVVVTAIGERQSRAHVAATVQTIDEETIERVKPVHAADLMARIPGVWVNTMAGEEHMTAIRQPLTSDPVYLYLENGVPTRSTAFINHNAVYEFNVPMAGDIEVMKGPGSALYGSDAIGGVVNVTTRRPPEVTMARLSMESGSNGYGRLMLSSGTQTGGNGLRLDVLAARSDGWRDASRYDRQSVTLTVNTPLVQTSRLRTVVSFTKVDQEPAGASTLSRDDFERSPTLNYAPISFHNVASFRISTAYERFTRGGAVDVTPYARFSRTSLLPTWSLTYDPSVRTSNHLSVGLLARYRHDFERIGLRAVAGLDLEASPGDHTERLATLTRDGSVFTEYQEGELIYRYDVTFQQSSPYLHAEYAPVDRLRISAGLRADLLAFVYDNRLDVATDGPHRRAADTLLKFAHLSPKLGATYALGTGTSAFLSYRHAFRVPSEYQLFRQGSTTNTLDLKPVKAENVEGGLRLQPAAWVGLDLSVYNLRKTDDIITYVDAAGVRISTNAGKTSHRGIEGGIHLRPVAGLQLTGSYSHAVHRFEEWRPAANADYSGNEMDLAPRSMGFAEVVYRPHFLSDLTISLEARRLGSYWMNPANTVEYEGYTILALRGTMDLPSGLTAFARVTNLTDALYAERATYNALRGEEFVPGQPRAIYVGVRYGIRGSR